jgi:hypothetical protein
MGRKDIQDQAGAVEHAHLENLFDIAGLAGCQLIVEHDQVVFELLAQRGDLFDFAGADEMLGEGLLQPLIQAADDIQAGGVGQQFQLA